MDYFTQDRAAITDCRGNGHFLKKEGYHTTLLGDEAVKLINNQDTTKLLLPKKK